MASDPPSGNDNSASTSATNRTAAMPTATTATAPIEDPASLFVDAEQSAAYAAHRPHYPRQLYDAIYAAAVPGRAPPFPDLTVTDVATGSGQALGPMPLDFGTCIALDVSASQLQALQLPPELRGRVALRQGDAHATGLPDRSVDLLAVGQALHWFRLEEFYRECRRVLKPTGALAAWTYGFGTLEGCPGGQELFEAFHSGTLGPHWASGRKLVDAAYVGIEPGPQHFGETRRVQLPMPASLTLDQLVGQIRSWSAYRSYLRAHPGQPDPLEELRRGLAERMEAAAAAAAPAAAGRSGGGIQGGGGGLARLTLRRTLTLLLALRPRAL